MSELDLTRIKEFAEDPPNTDSPADTLQREAFEQEQRVKGQGGVLERTAKGLGQGAFEYTKDVGQAAAIAAAPVVQGVQEGLYSENFLDGFNNAYQEWYDPNWSPGTNPDQAQEIEAEITRLRLDPNGEWANELRSSTGSMNMYAHSAHIEHELEQLSTLNDLGTAGLIGYITGSFFDADIIIGAGIGAKGMKAAHTAKLDELVANGSLKAEEAAKYKTVTSRGDNIVRTAVASGATSAGLELTNEIANPIHDFEDSIASVLMSAGFGGGIGALLPTRSIKDVSDHLVHSRVAEDVYGAKPDAPEPKRQPERTQAIIEEARINLDDSVGAARVESPEVWESTATNAIVDDAFNFFEDNPHYREGIADFLDFVETDSTGIKKGIQQSTEALYGALDKIGLSPSFDRSIRSGNTVLQKLAVQLQASPVKQIINHSSGDAWAEQMQKTFAGTYAPYHPKLLHAYAQQTGKGPGDTLGVKQAGDVKNFFSPNLRSDFSADTQKYMAYMREGRQDLAEQLPDSVKEMGQRINDTNKRILQEHHKAGTDDFADVDISDWYFSHQWHPDKVRDFENRLGTERLIQDLTHAIAAKAKPDVDPNLHRVWAFAIVQAAKDKNIGQLAGSFGHVGNQGKAYLTRAIQAAGLDEGGRSAEALAETMLYAGNDRGKIKSARARIDLDVTAPIGDRGETILDLLDNDVFGQTDVAVRGQAAEIARIRATGGELQRRNIEMYRKAVAAEAQKMGNDPAKDVELFDFMMSQFSEGAFAGGVSKNVGRLNKLTPLSFLAQGGFPAAAEVGLALGMGGLKSFENYFGKSVALTLRKAHADPEYKDLVDSLAFSSEYRAPQELYIGSANLDEVSSVSTGQVGKVVDSALDSGMRALGIVSGMHDIHKMSQNFVAPMSNNKMYQLALDPKGHTTRQLEAFGVTPEIARIAKENKEHFNLNSDGFVVNNNFDSWKNPEDADLWRRAVDMQMDWLVQTKRRGEEHPWAYSDIGSLFTSLRNFPLTALHTKTIRAGRQADTMVASMFVTQLALAAVAVGAKEIVNGRGDSMTTEKIAAKAIGWSAQFSPLMTFIDPALYYSGLDQVGVQGLYTESLARSEYGAFPMPAGFSVISDLANSIRAPMDLIEDGKLDWKTANSLQSLPILGRMYGTKLILDQLQE